MMKKFISRLLLFIIFTMILGEIIARMFLITSEIPRRIIDKDGIQKYIPSQVGYWKGGKHQWQINEKGWPGPLPEKWSPLITVIGDSYIENLMNPDSCHQSVLLKEKLPNFNFFETARAGVSFVGAMEIGKQNQNLNPKFQIIYLSDNDFTESIADIKALSDITQVNLQHKKLIPGKMKSPKAKLFLYNWKFAYYLYNRFPLKINFKSIFKRKTNEESTFKKPNLLENYQQLLLYVEKNYTLDNIVLVLRPETSDELIELLAKANFQYVHLKKKGVRSWSFDDDSHWSCYGHIQVANQVSEFLNTLR